MHDTTVVQPRRCPTLKDAEEKNTMDKSKERVKSKNLIDGGNETLLTVLNSSNASLAHIASVLGVGLCFRSSRF